MQKVMLEFMLSCLYGMLGVVCIAIAVILIAAVALAVIKAFKKKGGGGNGEVNH